MAVHGATAHPLDVVDLTVTHMAPELGPEGVLAALDSLGRRSSMWPANAPHRDVTVRGGDHED